MTTHLHPISAVWNGEVCVAFVQRSVFQLSESETASGVLLYNIIKLILGQSGPCEKNKSQIKSSLHYVLGDMREGHT